MSPLILSAILIFTTLATAFMSGLIGMAGGIVLMGVLLLVLPVGPAMVLHGFVQLVSNGWRAWLWRSYIKWRIVGQSFAGSMGALALFAVLSFVPDKLLVYLVLGLLPFVQYIMPPSLRLDITKRGQGLICGFIVTLMQLVSGVSGAMLDQFYAYSPLDRREQVATKAACQSIGHITKLIYFGGIMATASQLAELPLWLFPALIIAAMAGNSLAAKPLEKMSNGQFRVWSQRILLILGLYFLAQAAYLALAAP
jgi:uncharacterized membrane protein YfcA